VNRISSCIVLLFVEKDIRRLNFYKRSHLQVITIEHHHERISELYDSAMLVNRIPELRIVYIHFNHYVHGSCATDTIKSNDISKQYL